jgi:hypothetical protein
LQGFTPRCTGNCSWGRDLQCQDMLRVLLLQLRWLAVIM